ncbi:MAG: hypothetical protein QW700_08195, partial [Desulfurococcaceae archaeon]
MNVKTLVALGLIVAAILTIAATATLAAAQPQEITKITMVLKDQVGGRLANERVRIVIWNQSDQYRKIYPGGYPIAYFDGVTNSTGGVELKLTGITPLYKDVEMGGSYNITIAIYKYGKWFLLNQSLNLDYEALSETYFNTTVTATNWWTFKFLAVDYRRGEFLYSSSLYGPENASFIVYVDNVKVMEIWANENGEPDKLFNISDTEVTFRIPREGWFLIASKKNVTFIKEMYWNLRPNKGEILPILVGKDEIKVWRAADGTPYYNYTSLVGSRLYPVLKDFQVGLSPEEVNEIENYGFTYEVVLTNIMDLCNNPLTLGMVNQWSIAFQAEIGAGGKPVTLASGVPAPESTFLIPDVSLVYNKPVAIVIEYYGVPVLSIKLNLTEVELAEEDGVTFFETASVTGTATFESPATIYIETPVTVIPVSIQVFDKQRTPQPLAGALIRIEAAEMDPIDTATNDAGFVYMPPFSSRYPVNVGLPGGASGLGVVIEPVYEGYGYLPVPFEYNRSRDLDYVYTVRVLWRIPGGITWVDVTDPANSTIRLNPKRYIEYISEMGECVTLQFNIYANVFEVKVQLFDLCNRPLTPAAYPGATVFVYLNDALVSAETPGPDGSVLLKYVPSGELRLRLSWKGILMRANVTPPGAPEPVIKIDKNIVHNVPTLVFPIGNVILELSMWDVKYPLEGLNVTLVYYKDGKEVTREPWARTNCSGVVVFEKVPLLPLEPGRHEIRVLAYTWKTPYTRIPADNNLLVLNETLKWEKLAPNGVPQCENRFTLPTWIYSFKVAAVDHAGTVLKHFKTSIGDYPVTVILVDQAYEEMTTCCPELCPEIPLAYVLVDFRIVNATTEKEPAAVFTFWSQQYFESEDPMWQEKIGIKPHLFVAGAKYYFMVFHGGVLVYNYTITLPRPDATLTVYFNETNKKVSVIEGVVLDQYTWREHSFHPILVFKGAPSFDKGGARGDAELHLVTWVQTLRVETRTNAGKFIVPSLNLTLFRSDVLNWTIVGKLPYEDLINPDAWKELWTGYAWSARGNDKGVIEIQVPVWLPNREGESWLDGRNVKFGAEITSVYVLAGENWGSPGIPDTPKTAILTWTNGTGAGFTQNIFGYIVNWNHTKKERITDAIWFYPEWSKEGITFRGNNTGLFGDFWNMTYWSGASKTVRTVAMDGVCVYVAVPPPCPGETPTAYPDASVEIVAKDKLIASGVTDAEGKVRFAPPAVYLYKYVLEYTLRTNQSLKELLEPYKLTKDAANICPEWLEKTVIFTEDHNDFKECVEFAWSAIYVYIEDWGGKPLTNMMVAAYAHYPVASGGITTLAVSKPFAGAAVARLLVRPDRAYRLVVFWRDSYLLSAAKVIPSYISIYDSIADEIQPRLYSADPELIVPGYAVVTGGSIKTYVYIGTLQLLTKEGKALSPQALEKITVTITWPDGVVTQVKPGSDGVVPIILNKATAKKWPIDASATFNPESPHPQSPPGDYKVVVEWAGVEKPIAEKTLRITRAKLDTPEIKEPVLVDVVDVTITLSTPFNTPMAGASVTATKLDGTTITLTADAQG